MTYDYNTKYIYRVIYGPKSQQEPHDVIKKVFYAEPINQADVFVNRFAIAKDFARELYYNYFKAKAGLRVNNGFKDLVDVIAYKQDDGEIWIKTTPDHTKDNNLENLLAYAKFYGFAERENAVSQFR